MRPRVVELVEDVRRDAAGAPLAVDRGRGALDLDRDVVRVDLGPDAVEQDPPLAPDRRRRGGRVAAPQEQLGERLDDRAAVLAADLLAALGDGERGGEDRLGSFGRLTPVANRAGNIARQASASVDSPFMTARARSRSS